MSGLAFRVQDVYLASLRVERGPMKPDSEKLLQAQIGFQVAAAQFTPGESRVKVTTRFTIHLYLDGAPDELAVDDAPNLVGVVETRFTANVDTDRVVGEEDADDGTLDPAIELALPATHPYHRAAIESHTAMLGVPPFRLPVEWGEVAENLANAEPVG